MTSGSLPAGLGRRQRSNPPRPGTWLPSRRSSSGPATHLEIAASMVSRQATPRLGGRGSPGRMIVHDSTTLRPRETAFMRAAHDSSIWRFLDEFNRPVNDFTCHTWMEGPEVGMIMSMPSSPCEGLRCRARGALGRRASRYQRLDIRTMSGPLDPGHRAPCPILHALHPRVAQKREP